MSNKYEAEDKELLALIGKPYTRETARKMKYGGSTDANGNIAQIITRSQNEEMKKRCRYARLSMRFHLEDWEKIAIELIAIVVIIIIQFMSLWTLDVSAGAMMSGRQSNTGFILTNGFFASDPIQMYHLSLYMITVTTVLLSGIAIFYAVRTVAKSKKE